MLKKNCFRPAEVYHVSVMPCYDKKLEASRDDFQVPETQVREVDCVLTSSEVLAIIQERGIDFLALPESPLDSMYAQFFFLIPILRIYRISKL